MRRLTATEHQEQVAVIQWADAMRHKIPEARLIFAIPNGGERPRLRFFRDGAWVRFSMQGVQMKKEGVRPGIPDLFLPVARQEWHGLFIEMKSAGGSLRGEQQVWIAALTAQRYAVSVCRGSEEAINAITGYLMQATWSPARGRK